MGRGEYICVMGIKTKGDEDETNDMQYQQSRSNDDNRHRISAMCL